MVARAQDEAASFLRDQLQMKAAIVRIDEASTPEAKVEQKFLPNQLSL
jgi:hypothetical protein